MSDVTIRAMGWSATAQMTVEGAEASTGEPEARDMDCGIMQRHEGRAESVGGGMTSAKGAGPDQQELVKSRERIGRSAQDNQDRGGRRGLVLMRQKLRQDLKEDGGQRAGREVSGGENGWRRGEAGLEDGGGGLAE